MATTMWAIYVAQSNPLQATEGNENQLLSSTKVYVGTRLQRSLQKPPRLPSFPLRSWCPVVQKWWHSSDCFHGRGYSIVVFVCISSRRLLGFRSRFVNPRLRQHLSNIRLHFFNMSNKRLRSPRSLELQVCRSNDSNNQEWSRKLSAPFCPGDQHVSVVCSSKPSRQHCIAAACHTSRSSTYFFEPPPANAPSHKCKHFQPVLQFICIIVIRILQCRFRRAVNIVNRSTHLTTKHEIIRCELSVRVSLGV